MKKKELLSPVGNKESLMQAIHNGADAVYMAGKNYGARSYADNFDKDGLIDAIKYCHLYGVKIYITVNTLIENNEIDDFLDYIEFLYKNNVDAVIMQDVGMISRIRKLFPSLEIHASTQVHNNSIETVKLLKKLGVKRVVLARELSLETINNMDIDIEKEIFIHGALCVSYSGNCLFSSLHGSRSGNKGKCTGPCRLKYELFENNKKIKTKGDYLLSTKELNTINNIDKILSSNVDSLKIEGRMKSPEYVGFITRIYRNAIDSYYNNQEFILDEETLNKMKVLYNREYTNGFLFDSTNEDIMNINTSNHQGISIGKIVDFNKKYIKIKLNKDLYQEDGIRFEKVDKGMIVNKLYNDKELLTNKVLKGDIAIIENRFNINEKQEVLKTIDKNLQNELSKINYKKIKIDIKVKAKVDNKLYVFITDGINSVNMFGVVVEKSISSPISKENIIKQMSKLGNTPFIINNIDIDMDKDIFISIKELNDIRRELTDKLISLRENVEVNKPIEKLLLKDKKYIIEKNNINVAVRTKEQLEACLAAKVDNIYVYDKKIYDTYKNENIYLILDRVINNFKSFNYENIMVRELGSINKYNDCNNLIGDYTLNVTNNDSVKLLNNLNVKRVCLSVEIEPSNLKFFNKSNLEYIVYGKAELMIMKYCPLNLLLSDGKSCSVCKSTNNYYLKRDNELFPVKNNIANHITTIFDSKNIDYIDEINYIKKYVNNIRLNLFDEDYNDTLNLIERVRLNYDK